MQFRVGDIFRVYSPRSTSICWFIIIETIFDNYYKVSYSDNYNEIPFSRAITPESTAAGFNTKYMGNDIASLTSLYDMDIKGKNFKKYATGEICLEEFVNSVLQL